MSASQTRPLINGRFANRMSRANAHISGRRFNCAMAVIHILKKRAGAGAPALIRLGRFSFFVQPRRDYDEQRANRSGANSRCSAFIERAAIIHPAVSCRLG